MSRARAVAVCEGTLYEAAKELGIPAEKVAPTQFPDSQAN